MTHAQKYKTVLQYKGYTITFWGVWQARAYANESFDNTNLAKLKKEINNYLKS